MTANPSETRAASHFDRVTIAFHWLTAVLVLTLFASAVTWQNAPRAWGIRRPLEGLHVSLGILLAAAVVGMLLWRLLAGRKLPAADRGIRHVLAKVMHGLLYLLLTAQVVLGFLLRWFQGEAFSFFGLFSVPALIGSNDALADRVEGLHNLNAWTLIYLVALHSAAALLHHYWLKDGVLGRMIPALAKRGGAAA